MSGLAPSPRGLVNLGNTCYFNSIMQVLLNAPLLGQLLDERNSKSENKYTLNDPNVEDEERVELELPECDFAVKTLVELFKSYHKNNQGNSQQQQQAIAPSNLMNCIRQKTGRFQRLVQEDSHELLRSLIDIIRSDEMRRQKAAIASYLGDNKSTVIKADVFTLIDMLFGGYFLSSVKCQKCRFKSQHLEPFYDLSLAITDPISDISGAISTFTSNAILDGENKFICERCSKTNNKKTYEAGIKSTNIAVPPYILTLHLKRFEASGGGIETGRGLSGGRKGGGKKNSGSNGGGGRRKGRKKGGGGGDYDEDEDFVSCGRGGINFRKINKHIDFTEFLDLSDFTSDLCYDLTKINKWPRMNRGDPIWYSLFGVVCHSGNLRSGHYTAFIKTEEPMDENRHPNDFSNFIQTTPYTPELDIDKIRERIKMFDATRCVTTERYRDDESTNGAGDLDGGCSEYDYDRPKSIPGHWYHISDSQVRKSTLTNVLSSQAYILFYRRVI